MLKIYLETTMFNFYFDRDRGAAHEYTRELFRLITAGRFLGYTSETVIDELKNAPSAKYNKMSKLIKEYRIAVLSQSSEAERLAATYVNKGVVSARSYIDGLHLAIATVNRLDILASMNCRHIVKAKTIAAAAQINKDCGCYTFP